MSIKIISKQISSYLDLIKTLKKAMYSYFGKDKVTFTAAYPKTSSANSIKTPIIIYSILSKKPGSYGRNSEIKPRHRETLKDENGEIIEVYAQMFDYSILFEIWESDGETADETLDRFQKFIFQYTGYFKKLGVAELIFNNIDGKKSDNSDMWRADLSCRKVIYDIRIEEITGIKVPSIENIHLDTIVYENSFEMILSPMDHEDESLIDKERVKTIITKGDTNVSS